jgi:hypothetical protein
MSGAQLTERFAQRGLEIDDAMPAIDRIVGGRRKIRDGWTAARAWHGRDLHSAANRAGVALWRRGADEHHPGCHDHDPRERSRHQNQIDASTVG